MKYSLTVFQTLLYKTPTWLFPFTSVLFFLPCGFLLVHKPRCLPSFCPCIFCISISWTELYYSIAKVTTSYKHQLWNFATFHTDLQHRYLTSRTVPISACVLLQLVFYPTVRICWEYTVSYKWCPKSLIMPWEREYMCPNEHAHAGQRTTLGVLLRQGLLLNLTLSI